MAKAMTKPVCKSVGLLLLAWTPLTMADVVLDGTQGPSGNVALSNNAYQINANTMAQISGANAFFSFSRFNVEAGNTARFSASTSLENLLVRVTGGELSRIDGHVVSDVAGANLWLLNPQGVLMGAGSSVNVSGSLHIASADYILLPGGMQYSADTSKVFIAVSGNPLAVGVDPAHTAGGEVNLLGARMDVGAAENLSLVGGRVQVDGSYLQASSGKVQLLSIGESGEVRYSDNVYQSIVAAPGVVSVSASVLDGQVVTVADQAQHLALAEYQFSPTPLSLASAATELAVGSCQPRGFSGTPVEFEVREKEDDTHYFIRYPTRGGKASADRSQECVQP